VAVQCLFLPAAGLHRCLLHADDLRDAEEEERSPDRSQRPPQAGSLTCHLAHLVRGHRLSSRWGGK